MIITYDVSTQTLMNARNVALQRAAAEGWKSATIINITKVYEDFYSVTLTVHK